MNIFPGDVPIEVFSKILLFIDGINDLQHLLLVSKDVSKAADTFIWPNFKELAVYLGVNRRREWFVRLKLNGCATRRETNIALLWKLVRLCKLTITFYGVVDNGLQQQRDTNTYSAEYFFHTFANAGHTWCVRRLMVNICVSVAVLVFFSAVIFFF